MTDISEKATSHFLSEEAQRRVRKRYAAERRFRAYGVTMICIAVFFLVVLFYTIISRGYSAFEATNYLLPITFSEETLELTPAATEQEINELSGTKLTRLARQGLYDTLGIDSTDRSVRRLANRLLSSGVDIKLRDMLKDDPSIIGTTQEVWVLAHGSVDPFIKGKTDRTIPESMRLINDQQFEWIDRLEAEDRLALRFNINLFTGVASAEPELAGIAVAVIGSGLMMLIVLLVALPIGVGAAIYLEEFAPKNKLTDLIEVNISNLAAVPSIVFGILGLAVFINILDLPMSAPIVGGLVLSLMTLPTVIISTRAALRAVPPSIREAALGVGASKVQAMFHHTLPLAMPGILTGTIIGLAQALGETAPLLMIGMVAQVFTVPESPLDPATALPVQIYIWSGAAERGFVALTSAGIIILLAFLLTMNATAIYFRKRFERRW